MPDVFGADGRVSTHSRLKAAGLRVPDNSTVDGFQHTAA